MAAGDFIHTDVFGTFVLLEAARDGAAPAAVRPDLDRRGLRQRARPGTAARPTSCGRAIRTRRARPAPIGWPTATGRPTACRSSSRARRTTTGRTSFRRKSSRSSSPTRSTTSPLPLYGDGLNVRDWLHVDDHCRALDLLIERGARRRGLQHRRRQRGRERRSHAPHPRARRPAGVAHHARGRSARPRPPLLARHDASCARSAGRRRCRSTTGLAATVEWYRANEWWWRPIKEQDPAFRAYYQAQYGGRRSPA